MRGKSAVIRFIFVVGLVLSAMPAMSAPDGAVEPVVEALVRASLPMRAPEKAAFTDAALAGSRVVAVGERGLVILSDNGGRSWRQAPCPVSVTLTAVCFVDERHGMAVGHGGAVLNTDDGGESWALRLDGRRAAQLALDGAQIGQNARVMSDAQWLVDSGPDKPFLDLLMFDKDTALVVGAFGLAYATSDGGAHWHCWMDRFENPKGLHYNAVRKRGDVIVIAGEQGLLLRSDDGGKHFQRVETPYDGTFFTLELPSAGEIVVAGLRGNILRSRNDGQSWESCPPPMPISVTGSTLLADNHLLLVNQAGFILGWSEGKLVPINSQPLPVPNGLLCLGDGGVLALTIQGVVNVNLQASSKANSQ